MVRKLFFVLLLLGAFAGAGVNRASAHHSAAQFDPGNPVTLDGVITSVKWMNPHSWIYLDVKDASGATVNWALETVSPAQFAQRVPPSLLKVGVRIIAKGNGMHDRTQHFALLNEFILDGKTYNSSQASGREGRGR